MLDDGKGVAALGIAGDGETCIGKDRARRDLVMPFMALRCCRYVVSERVYID